MGFALTGEEPLKITVRFERDASDTGKDLPDGENLAGFLKAKGIYTEYHDAEHVVMMFSPGNEEEDYARTLAAFEEFIKHYPEAALRNVHETCGKVPESRSHESRSPESGYSARKSAPERALDFREALFADFEEVDVHESIGRVLAEPLVHCPPCVPPYMLGEVIGKDIGKYCSGKIRVVR
jgi:arginine/lysine/ornithine decarboxylase